MSKTLSRFQAALASPPLLPQQQPSAWMTDPLTSRMTTASPRVSATEAQPHAITRGQSTRGPATRRARHTPVSLPARATSSSQRGACRCRRLHVARPRPSAAVRPRPRCSSGLVCQPTDRSPGRQRPRSRAQINIEVKVREREKLLYPRHRRPIPRGSSPRRSCRRFAAAPRHQTFAIVASPLL